MTRTLFALPLLFVACVPPGDPDGDLEITLDDTSIEGTFERDGKIVEFKARSFDQEQRVTVDFDIDGTPLAIVLDLAGHSLVEDAHGSSFEVDDRDILLALRDAFGKKHPGVIDRLHGKMVVKAADRYAEVPVGRALTKHEVMLHAELRVAVQSGCGGDGVSCLSGTSGTSWAVFSAAGQCQAYSANYGDSVCRGRCGIGCNWFDEDYTWDCHDHDVCLDYYNGDCSDEFNDAADDWAATVAPLCWSGSNRSQPPVVPVCGNGSVESGEACDDGNTAPGDGCSAACTVEQPEPPPPDGHLVINEVEYDEPGTDAGEFVEIYNGTSQAIELSNLALVFVNGSTSLEYSRIPLSGSLPAGKYLVVCPQGSAPGTCAAGVSVPPDTMIVNFPIATNALQNGSPDAVALVDLMNGTLVDALSYEGSVNAATITDVGTFDLVEQAAATVADNGTYTDALARFPNGTDSDNASTDWAKRPPTPGAPNL
ncbi:MAG TPA: lamin tail domain-containing protein [Polyangiaceae bacterium]|jgi:cysteine-rich repeat protein|nr:lamin tail domain-containing protein [Polyangiaceae bacterium]